MHCIKQEKNLHLKFQTHKAYLHCFHTTKTIKPQYSHHSKIPTKNERKLNEAAPGRNFDELLPCRNKKLSTFAIQPFCKPWECF